VAAFRKKRPALGRPVLIMRELTERPEVIDAGSAALVGTDPDRLVAAVADLVADPARYARMAEPAFPYGAGDTGLRIAAIIEDYLASPPSAPRAETPLPCPADP
jgi:UDP-N-acetylglucosamine 2-epimerase (non-hydrolysing)